MEGGSGARHGNRSVRRTRQKMTKSFKGSTCPEGHAMAVTDFREGAYVNGIVCDGCTVAIPLLTLRYFCRQCYDEHPASGGADYCMECVQPGVVVKTTVHSAATLNKFLIQLANYEPGLIDMIRLFTQHRIEVTFPKDARIVTPTLPTIKYDFDSWETFDDIITAVVAKKNAPKSASFKVKKGAKAPSSMAASAVVQMLVIESSSDDDDDDDADDWLSFSGGGRFGIALGSGGNRELFPGTHALATGDRKAGKALNRSMVPFTILRYLQERVLQCGPRKLECVYARVRPESLPQRRRWGGGGGGMMMRMFQPENAQNGFDPVTVPPYLAKGTRLIALPSRETMNAVINKECELRLLPETLAAFKNNDMDDEDARIIAVIQLAAGAAYGLGKEAPDLIRCAQQLYPGLEAFKNAHYIKHNKIDQGVLKQGDAIPSVKLSSIHDGGSTTVDLKDVVAALSPSSLPSSPSTTSAVASGIRHDRPLVVAAGSYT